MKSILKISFIVIAVSCLADMAIAQPFDAKDPTEVIGRVCKTMEQHPAPTAEDNYALLDYAICGPGGLRVYPNPEAAGEFNTISTGVLGQKAGSDMVYMHGYMTTRVMSAFGTPGAPASHPRFRFSWLAVDKVKKGLSISDRPKMTKKGDTIEVSLNLMNPLDKPISGTEVILSLNGALYPRPFVKPVPTMNPKEKIPVTFEVVAGDKMPTGNVHIKNYGRVYIDVVEEL